MTLGSRTRGVLHVLQQSVRHSLDERIVFLHVPKCGGNSVRRALAELYGWPLPKSRRRWFHDAPRRSERAAALLGRPVEDLRDDLLRYQLCDGHVRLVTGHFRWPDALRDQFPDVSFVSLLREPVSHLLSVYYFQREERGQAAHKRETADLPQFLESDRARRAGAMYVRLFGAPAGADQMLAPDVLQRARQRLASVEVLGVLEDLPAFAQAFERRFGRRLRIPHLNAGRLRPAREREDVTDELRARMAEVVRPNQELYDFVRRERLGQRD
jgi:hypothetical protein